MKHAQPDSRDVLIWLIFNSVLLFVMFLLLSPFLRSKNTGLCIASWASLILSIYNIVFAVRYFLGRRRK